MRRLKGALKLRSLRSPAAATTGSIAFHPKAYIFWSSAGGTAAGYVGSSNLSASGIDGGVEWNLGTDRVEQLVAGFESLWTDERSEPLDAMSHAVTSAERHPRGAPADRGGPPVTMLA